MEDNNHDLGRFWMGNKPKEPSAEQIKRTHDRLFKNIVADSFASIKSEDERALKAIGSIKHKELLDTAEQLVEDDNLKKGYNDKINQMCRDLIQALKESR